jgi:Protein of unknown function (DUF1569)
MIALKTLVQQLEAQIPNAAATNTAVTASTVGWQIEHALLTINQIIRTVAASNPSEYKWSFNLMRTVVFFRQCIPRGRAKAPKVVQPKDNVTEATILAVLAKTHELLEVLPTLETNNFFPHPYFGKLNKQQTIIFLNIHTAHHLHIIKDIIGA